MHIIYYDDGYFNVSYNVVGLHLIMFIPTTPTNVFKSLACVIKFQMYISDTAISIQKHVIRTRFYYVRVRIFLPFYVEF